MRNLSAIGRLFYGTAIAAMGALTIYYRDVPYMMLPPGHRWLSDHLVLMYLFGALFIGTGACIALGKKLVPVSLVLGTVLLSIFCFSFVPYE